MITTVHLKCLLIFLCINGILTSTALAQGGTWTWMKGDTTFYNHNFSYGTEGMPAMSNEPSGRYDANFWTDTAGNFWVYGGVDPFGKLADDLWRFDPSTMMWTWMNSRQSPDSNSVIAAAQGVFSTQNKPRSLAYCSSTWVTKDNHLWMLGGQYQSVSDVFSSEIWQYDPAIDQWAWMGNVGPLSFGTKGQGTAHSSPGGRIHGDVSWVDDSGNLWLYGGILFDQHIQYWLAMGDVWKYNPINQIWTWMSGDSVSNSPGVYGPVGTPSVNYWPQARMTDFFWKDNKGSVWIIGGENWISTVFYNDVWKFNPANLEWTLIRGSATPDTGSVSAGTCSSSHSNIQGGRYQNRAVWKPCDAAVFNYGGFFTPSGYTFRNEVWAFLPQQQNWDLIASAPNAGHYGSIGVASSSNFPPARTGSAGFTDKYGNFWLFSGNNQFANDLWKFSLDTSCMGAYLCPKPVQTTGLSNEVNNTFSYDALPNPADNSLNITLPDVFTNGTLTLYDLTGKSIMGLPIHSDLTLSTSGISSGIYLLTLISDDGRSVTKKIVISH